MTQNVIAQININDREAYGRYQAEFMPILILPAFDDGAAVRNWVQSADYKRIPSIENWERLASAAVFAVTDHL